MHSRRMQLRGASLALCLVLALTSGAAAQSPTCVLQFAAAPESFASCFRAENVGESFFVAWSPVGANKIRWGLNASADAHTYVSLGYPGDSEENAMLGGTAFVLQPCGSCASGLQLRQILMEGTSSGEMKASAQLPMDAVVTQKSNGWIMGAFTTDLPPPAEEQEVIYASGEVYRNGDLRMHSSYGVMVVDLGAGSASDPEYFSKPVDALLTAHIWLLLIGWGLFIPLGVATAFLFGKPFSPVTFNVHRALQCSGLLLGLIGFGLGFAVAGGWTGAFSVHRNLGVAATVMGVLQLGAVFRPKLSSRYRRGFNVVHWWTGRAATLCAVANIYYGLAKMINTGNWGWGAYTAVFGTIVAGAIAYDSWRYLQHQPPASAGKGAVDAGDGYEAAANGKSSGAAQFINGNSNGSALTS